MVVTVKPSTPSAPPVEAAIEATPTETPAPPAAIEVPTETPAPPAAITETPPAPAAPRKKLVVELPAETHLKLRVYAAKSGKTLTDSVNDLLKAGLVDT